MTDKEERLFREYDEKEYILDQNSDLVIWLNEKKEEGYNYFTDLNDLQDLINDIANAYIYNLSFDDVVRNLPDKEKYLIYLKYFRSPCELEESIYLFDRVKHLFINNHNMKKMLNNKTQNEQLMIIYDALYGRVIKANSYLNKDLNNRIKQLRSENDKFNIKDLKEVLKEYKDYDIKELEDIISNYEISCCLRKKIFNLIALKILYSSILTVDSGYKKAKKFINDVNKNLDIDLSTAKLDYLINIDYKTVEKEKVLTK